MSAPFHGGRVARREQAPASLRQLQHWIHRSITGEAPPEDADANRALVASPTLDAVECLAVHRRGYRARLIEALRESLPLLRIALGDDLFAGFADDYLAKYPPSSWTLDHIDRDFLAYLRDNRPDREAIDSLGPNRAWWPDFMIDLVRLDQTTRAVFHAAGAEGAPCLDADEAERVLESRRPGARFLTSPALALIEVGFPVIAWAAAARKGANPPPPRARRSHLVIHRIDYRVHWRAVGVAEWKLVSALAAGANARSAIRAAGLGVDGARRIVRAWAERGLFMKSIGGVGWPRRRSAT